MLSPCSITPPTLESLQEIAHTQTDLLLDCLVAVYADLYQQQQSSIRPQFESLYRKIQQLRINKNDFEHIRPLAQGQFGQVSIVRHKKDGQVYAMKTLQKEHVLSHHERTFYMEERNVLATATMTSTGSFHPWIPKLHWAFQDEDHLYIVMEYAGGGDLFSVLLRQNNECLTEQEARFYIAETIVAVDTLHQMGYIHRDIKPQNILIDHTGHVKIADFGSCISIQNAKKSPPKVAVGTCDYVAPEILQAQEGNTIYGTEVDWWSVGIVLYEALQVVPPFYNSESEKQTYFNIMLHETKLEFNDDLPISAECKDLIRKLLSKRETRLGRNGVQEIQEHPFFNGIDWKALRKTNPPFQPVLTSPDDTSNFSDANENEDEGQKDKYPWTPSSATDLEQRYIAFIGFSFSGVTTEKTNGRSSQSNNIQQEQLLRELHDENKRLLHQIQSEAKTQRENKHHAIVMNDLQNRIDALTKENAQLKSTYEETHHTLDREKCEREKTVQDLTKAQKHIDTLMKFSQEKDRMKKEWMTEQEKILKELDEARQQIQHLKYEMDRRKKARDDEQQQQQQHDQDKETVLKDKDNQLKKYKHDLEHLQDQITKLKKQHDTQLQQVRDDEKTTITQALQKQHVETWERLREKETAQLQKQHQQALDQLEMHYKSQIQQILLDDENNSAQLQQMQRKKHDEEIQHLHDEKEKELQILRDENIRLKREKQEQRDTASKENERLVSELQLLHNEIAELKRNNHSNGSIHDDNGDSSKNATKTSMMPSIDRYNNYKKNGIINKQRHQKFTDINTLTTNTTAAATIGTVNSATSILSVQKQKVLPLLPMPIREGQLKIMTSSSSPSPWMEYHVKLQDGVFYATCSSQQLQKQSKLILDFRGSTVLVQEGTLEQEKRLGVTSSLLLVLRIINKHHQQHKNASSPTSTPLSYTFHNSITKIDQQLTKEQQYIQGAQKTLQARKKLLASSGTMVMYTTKQQRQIQLELEQAIVIAQSKINQLLKERELLIKENDGDNNNNSKKNDNTHHDVGLLNGNNNKSTSSLIKNHDFKNQKATKETKCGFCQDVLWGPRALACQKCQYSCHPQCPVDISCEEYKQLMQCTPYYLYAKDLTERSKWRHWLERSVQRYSDINREKTLSR